MTDTVREIIQRFSTDQFSNEERLNARVQVYRYAEREIDFHRWLFEQLDFSGVTEVADLGCGTGLLWTKNRERIPGNIRVMLSDSSDVMVDVCREHLADDGRFSFQVADAAGTPFESYRYDMVLANHMLNFFPDPEKCLTEIKRLLADGGTGYATTPSTGHFGELFRIAEGFDDRLLLTIADMISSFNAENGAAILSGTFGDVDTTIFQNDVVTVDTDALMLYLASCYEGEQLEIMLDSYDAFRKHIESAIVRNGNLRITNRSALFTYRKKPVRYG